MRKERTQTGKIRDKIERVKSSCFLSGDTFTKIWFPVKPKTKSVLVYLSTFRFRNDYARCTWAVLVQTKGWPRSSIKLSDY